MHKLFLNIWSQLSRYMVWPNLPHSPLFFIFYSIYCSFVFDMWLSPSTWSLHMMFNRQQVSNQNRHTTSQTDMNRRQIEWGKKDNSICLHLAHFSQHFHAAVLSPSEYTCLAVQKIISLDSCSLIKLYNGRRCRKLCISQIPHVPEKIQYWGKNTSWQWWLHKRVLSRITFLTELSSESLLTAPNQTWNGLYF